jgi:tetratricopeptide (TPR) repeat protein
MAEEFCTEQRANYEEASEKYEEALDNYWAAIDKYDGAMEEAGYYYGKAEEAIAKLKECEDDENPQICTAQVIAYWADYIGYYEDKLPDVGAAEEAVEHAELEMSMADDEMMEASAALDGCLNHWGAKKWTD